jgi:hypothetical protein
MDTKAKQYTELTSKFEIPFYLESWTFNSLCGENNWTVLESKIEAYRFFLPIGIKKKGIFKTAYIPAIILFGGPLIVFENAITNHAPLQIAQEAAQILLKKLQAFDHFCIQGNTNHFFWSGISNQIKIKLRPVFILNYSESLHPIETYSKQIVRSLKKANSDTLLIEKTKNTENLIHLLEQTYVRQNLKMPMQKSEINNFLIRGLQTNRIEICEVHHQDNCISACAFIYDSDTIYYCLASSNPEYKNLNAPTFLINYGVETAWKLKRNFNFYGSSISGIATFFKKFGSEETQYESFCGGKSRILELLYNRTL